MIIFVGVSGAGKGTQSEMLKRENGYTYLATGDMLRNFASLEQKARMLNGQLLSDEEMVALVREVLQSQDNPNKVILDGFPRTVAQAEWLLAHAVSGHYAIEAVIHLDARPDVVLSRLQSRAREDDTPEAINARMAWYETHTKPVLELFRTHGCPVLYVDGNRTSGQVHASIRHSLASIGSGSV